MSDGALLVFVLALFGYVGRELYRSDSWTRPLRRK
jgi:hypothetical protein